jgi:hypothetical protein|tara:strand:- start:919 stop:1254 length:336 start_codon:yes stop_codon:yes gene_type:complete
MANAFKNKGLAATGTALTDAYTAGSGVTATVIGLTCANISSTSPILVSIKFYDASANANYFVVKDAQIYTGGALVAVGGDQKLVLEAGDKIKVISNTAASVDTIVSVMEQS